MGKEQVTLVTVPASSEMIVDVIQKGDCVEMTVADQNWKELAAYLPEPPDAVPAGLGYFHGVAKAFGYSKVIITIHVKQ